MRPLASTGLMVGFAAAFCSLGQTCIPAGPPGGEDLANAPVYITGSEFLNPPAVGLDRSYQPTRTFAIGAEQAAGFRLTVATRAPDHLRARLRDNTSGIAQDLQRVEPPTPDERAAIGGEPQPFNDTVRSLLAAGISLFWHDDSDEEPGAVSHRFVFLMPESARGPFSQIEVYTATAPDGSAVFIDHIELVRGFYYMAVLGDSVAWGNGLLDSDKYAARVANAIEQATERKVVRQMLALSGARIVPDAADGICGISCYREAPAVSTSITAQIDLVQRPELVSLVLMNGCINDIQVSTIINPDTTEDELVTASAQFCKDAMTALLATARARLPQATIVVTGYYPMISEASDILGLLTWLNSQEVSPNEDIADFSQAASMNSRIFADVSRADLAAAVVAAGAAAPAGPPMLFVDPGFPADNAVFTPDSWLWGLSADSPVAADLSNQLKVFPEDPQFAARLPACFTAAGAELSLECVFASLGHPNKRGSQAYADAIIAGLRSVGVLPIAP